MAHAALRILLSVRLLLATTVICSADAVVQSHVRQRTSHPIWGHLVTEACTRVLDALVERNAAAFLDKHDAQVCGCLLSRSSLSATSDSSLPSLWRRALLTEANLSRFTPGCLFLTQDDKGHAGRRRPSAGGCCLILSADRPPPSRDRHVLSGKCQILLFDSQFLSVAGQPRLLTGLALLVDARPIRPSVIQKNGAVELRHGWS